jgi:signal peptidase I
LERLNSSFRPGLFGPVAIFVASLAAFYLYVLSSAFVPVLGSLLLYLGSQVGLLGLVALFAKSDRTKLTELGLVVHERPLRTVLVALGLSGLFFLITLEPGFIFGFQRVALPAPPTFAVYLFSAPVVALSQEAVFRGFILRKLATRWSFNRALYLSSFFYALFSTNLLALVTLPYGASMQSLFSITLENLVLGLLLGTYFYKSSWSLLGPVALRTGLILQTSLFPFLPKVPSWEFQFTFQLAGYMVVMLLVTVLLREPGVAAARYLKQAFGAKRYRMALREKRRKDQRNTLIAAPILITLVLVSSYGTQALLGTGTPFLAIASGSMVPTLHVGDLVVLHGVSNASQIAVGDIVAYHNTLLNETVIHRIIRISQSGGALLFTFKGDANKAADPLPVQFSQIKGKLILHVPAVGYLLLSPPLAVVLVLAVLLASSIRGSSEQKSPRGEGRG